ncbi:hypothetical protein C8R11_11711 [Nitrosomonas aestuarii]|nr:hypothetical protein C8R11_11711 [Nitrosomonas aestuarii]
MTVFVNEANSCAFDPVRCLQHDRKTDSHSRYAEWSRHREKYDTHDKNDYSDRHKEGAFEHSQIILFMRRQRLDELIDG